MNMSRSLCTWSLSFCLSLVLMVITRYVTTAHKICIDDWHEWVDGHTLCSINIVLWFCHVNQYCSDEWQWKLVHSLSLYFYFSFLFLILKVLTCRYCVTSVLKIALLCNQQIIVVRQTVWLVVTKSLQPMSFELKKLFNSGWHLGEN
jgi:hypothetical protein